MRTSDLCLFLAVAGVTSAIAQDYSGRLILGKEVAQKQVHEAIKTPLAAPFGNPILSSEEVAIAVAEPILFQVFGRKQILTERPYEAYLLDGYWFITGTLPKGWRGGTFEIILAASDGRVVRLTHYK